VTVMSFKVAIREALRSAMRQDSSLFLLGEDVGRYGGELGVTGDLWQEFGEFRIRDTPISETAVVGCALGAAMTGCRAVVEIPFSDFVGVCMDQLFNQVAKLRYMSGGQVRVPLVVRTTMGGYAALAAQHSQCMESWFVHMPGIKVVVPSTPADAMGLLRSALADDNPVIFFEHKSLYPVEGEVPDDADFHVPLGAANVVRQGTDVTVLASALQLQLASEAAECLAEEGIRVELIDPRTLDPLDTASILASVARTHHLVVCHETWTTGGYGAEIAARVADQGFRDLAGPVKRVGAKHVPIPFSPALEKVVLPQVDDICGAVKETLGR
jgi:pyruvate/2-oxoglutarate/acetoin dehydrogenase E1 component